ncbi:hypothetical protein ALC56_05867 [Trachymyrmex septentrionalis]|uniref:Coiled-coil domain-containing protein 63 n=1 Tax=Trachymyrmex septentrionalis TaxID=34720 RepID=A0A151JXK4_9HYME|nr:hypothetical protein ALC56_05867 [Trachymyrmex septentrionalis]
MGRAKAPKEIRVETWLIRDKISRYRGILKLHARDKKLQLSQATKLKSIVSKKITSLDVDVKRHYEIVSHLRDGGKQPILRLLTDKRVYLAVNHLKPSEIYAAIHQDCSSKRRLLDKLYYEKKKRLKRDFLDAIFFDTLMNILKEDQSSQCKVMLKVTVMGQLAAENLDDIRQKYKRMSRVVWQNMKIREQMLSTVNSQVKDLWAYAQSLVRAESDHIFMKKDIDLFNKTLENQLAHLENICTEVKDVLLVRSYHDLLLRFENQSEHRVALLARLDINIKNREVLLSKKHHALQVLEGLKYSTKEQYKTNNTQDILEQIEIEKKREKDLREQITAHGELITHVRAALQNMNTMLLCFKHMKEMVKKPVKNAKKELMIINGKEDIEERDALAEVERMDTDVLALLSKISQKIHTLFNISNFELQGEKEDQARDLYHTYVSNYNSNLIFGTGEEEPIGLLVEHEMIDVAIPTRADIKYYSRQILEAHLKPE